MGLFKYRVDQHEAYCNRFHFSQMPGLPAPGGISDLAHER
jgi:hypothetical protein